MKEFSVYVGLDVHKDTIAVAIAVAGRDAPQYYGEIANTPTAIKRLMTSCRRTARCWVCVTKPGPAVTASIA